MAAPVRSPRRWATYPLVRLVQALVPQSQVVLPVVPVVPVVPEALAVQVERAFLLLVVLAALYRLAP